MLNFEKTYKVTFYQRVKVQMFVGGRPNHKTCVDYKGFYRMDLDKFEFECEDKQDFRIRKLESLGYAVYTNTDNKLIAEKLK